MGNVSVALSKILVAGFCRVSCSMRFASFVLGGLGRTLSENTVFENTDRRPSHATFELKATVWLPELNTMV